jgi:hypothetical protein
VDRQVWQVTCPVAPSSAEVVEVQLTGAALAAHDDQPSLAAMTPDDALEVVMMVTLALATGTALV